MKKLTLYKEGPYVYVTNNELKETVRFNLITKCMERINKYKKSRPWVAVKSQYHIFRNCSLYDVEFKDPIFAKLIELCSNTYYDTKSISTYIANLDRVLRYEPFLQQGFNCRASWDRDNHGNVRPRTINFTIKDLNKTTLKLMKETNQPINYYTSLPDESTQQFTEFLNSMSELDTEEKTALFDEFNTRYRASEAWRTLINDYNFEPKALIKYLMHYLRKFEGLEFGEGIVTLKDYYRMAKTIGRDVKKYPKYLKSMHDIIQSNYNAYKTEYDEIQFAKLMKPDFEYDGKEFVMINPKGSKDIVKEGTDNNHCVGSYVDDILKERTYIIFLRAKDTKDEPEQSQKSLVTVELDFTRKQIVQARGSYNRKPTDEEMKFLEEYGKKKEMELKL